MDIFIALTLAVSAFYTGVIFTNRYIHIKENYAKFAMSFFLGIFFISIVSFIFSFLFRQASNPLYISILCTLFLQILLFFYWRKYISLKLIAFEIVGIICLFLFGMYIMTKSFSYINGSFVIASNQYVDFGAHIPIIRSFSLGKNFPPFFPFMARVPLAYHFLFDYTVAIFESIGIRIDYALNLLSALSFSGLLILIFSLARKITTSKKFVPIVSVLLFLFPSNFSFFDGLYEFKKKGNFLQTLYHHNIYFADGPFGKSIVSIFWSLNTYLNQRHFLYGIGIFLILLLFFINPRKKIKNEESIFTGIFIGLLPFWHTSIFTSLVFLVILLFVIAIWRREENKKSYAVIILVIICISLPQLLFIKFYAHNFQIGFKPGFLLAENLNVLSLIKYWVFNLGLAVFTIPIGVYLLRRKVTFIPVFLLLLFLLPNLFQFTPQMFDNHKFFNLFIIIANIYTAYVLWVMWKKNSLTRVFCCILFFFLTISGVYDFFVIKNDVKAIIPDYPTSNMSTWEKNNLNKNEIILTNKEIYDPVNLVGLPVFIGRSHYMWEYGVNPDSRLIEKNAILYSSNSEEIKNKLRENDISYLVLYNNSNNIINKKYYDNTLQKIFISSEGVIYKIRY